MRAELVELDQAAAALSAPPINDAPALRLAPAAEPESASPILPLPPLVLHGRVVAGSGGGPDKTILRSARYIDPASLRMAAAYIHPHGDGGFELIRHQARTLGCRLFEVPERGALDVRTVRHLLHLCRRLRVTIWHGHDYKSNALGLLLRRFWPMKLVTTMHGWTRETARTRLYYHLDNLCLPRYDHVFAVSPQLRAHCRSLGVPAERLSYLPNAIEPDDYEPHRDGALTRLELGVAGDALVIGVVGRFSPEKGVERAIRAFAVLRARYPKAELHLVGDGPQCRQLNLLVRELKLAEAVRFWGWQPNTRRFYELMDVLLLPSHSEGLPNVLLEAMAMGVAVAATDVGGVGELLERGRCGVVLSQDAATWPAHLAPLLVSADRRAELARRGRQRIETRYNFRQRMKRELEVYRQLLRIQRRLAA